MKYIKYLIIALTGILAAACAEEDPYEVGAIDVTVTASQVTSTTATINVDLTKCAELFSDEAFNVDAYGSRYNQYCYVSLFEYTDWGRTENFVIRSTEFPNIINLTGKVTFKNLQPSTTYTFCVIITSPIGGVAYRRDDFTFTTTKEGDYSALADISPYEILVNDNICVLGFGAIFDISPKSITLSENEDLSNPLIKLDELNHNSGAVIERVNWDSYTTSYEYTVFFKGLKANTKYYWAFSGDFDSHTGLNLHDFETEIYSFTTKDGPDDVFSALIESSMNTKFKINFNRYCSFDNTINYDYAGLNCRGTINLAKTPESTQKADCSLLQLSTDYYFDMHFSQIVGTYNGHQINLYNFNYIPQNPTIRTPDPVAGQDNSETNPATATQIIDHCKYYNANKRMDDIWLKGYIVGYISRYDVPTFSSENAEITNILIADSPNVQDDSKCVLVQGIDEKLNLKAHPENLGREVVICGNVGEYYNGYPGLNNISQFKLI